MQVLCARDPRFGVQSSTVHSVATPSRASTPLMTTSCQANRQTSPAFMKAQSARVLSTGTPNYQMPALGRSPQVTSSPQLPQAYSQTMDIQQQQHHQQQQQRVQQQQQQQQQQQAPQPKGPSRSTSTDSKFGAQAPAPLPSRWAEDFEVASEAPVLGGGAFAEVFKIRHLQTNQHFAVKVMHRPNFTLRGIERQIEMEIRAMVLAARQGDEAGRENYIVRLIDFAEEGEYVFLMLEMCASGDLLRMVYMQPGQRFPEALAHVWTRQLLQGLGTLHKLGIIHRDIKPDNLLCTEQGVLKIADFGWCAEAVEAPTALAGTFQYMAPEVLQNIPQTEKADVWSAGVTLYQLLLGKPLLNTYLGPGATNISARDPHEATAVKQRWLLEEIRSTCPPSQDLRPQDISPLCWDFLRRLLQPDVTARCSVVEALQHPWFESFEEPQHQAPEAGSVSIMRSSSAGAVPNVARIEETRESEDDMSQPENTGDDALILTAKDEKAPGSVVIMSPAKITKARHARSPYSEKTDRTAESLDNVPSPEKPRPWDPSRNVAYSPPVKKCDPERELGETPEDEENAERSPERSPERCHVVDCGNERISGADAEPLTLDCARLLTSPGRDLDLTPRDQYFPPPEPVQLVGGKAAAATRGPCLDGSMKARAVSPAPGGHQTPVCSTALPAGAHRDSVPLVAVPYPRSSPNTAGRSVSPTVPTRVRGTSLGSPLRYATGRRPGLGGVGPAVSAPRLRLSAPGDLIGGSMPAGALSTGTIPQLSGSAGPLTTSPKQQRVGRGGLMDSAGSWRMRTRPDSAADPHALLTELHKTNENLRMAFVQLVSNMSTTLTTPSSVTMPANNLERTVREDVAKTNAMLEPFLPRGHGAASAPVASPVLNSADLDIVPAVEAVDVPDELNVAVVDVLSATAPPQLHIGASTPCVLAPIYSTRDGQAVAQSLRTRIGAGRRVASELGLATARGCENSPPLNQCANDGKAWLTAKSVHGRDVNTRQAGSVQVRQGSMPRYGQVAAGQVRECRTPLVPNWPRAASPDTRRCSLSQTVKAVPSHGQGSTTLPPPRLAATQPRSGGAGHALQARIAATTPTPAQTQHVWAYPTANAVYRGCDERRRASVPGSHYYARTAA